MHLIAKHFTTALSLSVGAFAPFAHASHFLDFESFEAAVANGNLERAVLDFEDMAVGSLIPSGGTVSGITFEYDILDFTLAVEGNPNGYTPGTSGDNNLALTQNGGQTFGGFALGDSIRFVFDEPMYGFGFFVVVGNPNFDFWAEDINLIVGSTTYSNAGGEIATMRGETPALFFGVLEENPFTEITLRFGDINATSGGMFWLDEINTVAVPEPSTYALGAGLMAMIVLVRRVRGKRSRV